MIKQIFDISIHDPLAFYGFFITLAAFIFAAYTILLNAREMKKSYALKNKEIKIAAQKELYDRRIELRNRLLWLNLFTHNWIHLCGLRIETVRQNYYMVDENQVEQKYDTYKDGKFAKTVLSEIIFLQADFKILFPHTFLAYKQYCEQLKTAYFKDLQNNPVEAVKDWDLMVKQWEKIVFEDIPAEMSVE